MGHDLFRSPKELLVLQGWGVPEGITTQFANTSNLMSDIIAPLKSHHFPHKECFISTSLGRAWPAIMFLASPPRPDPSRPFPFLLQDPTPLPEMPVDYSCFYIVQNDFTFFFLSLWFSHLKHSERTWPFTTK